MPMIQHIWNAHIHLLNTNIISCTAVAEEMGILPACVLHPYISLSGSETFYKNALHMYFCTPSLYCIDRKDRN
jgi:hypothetical protein